MPSRSVFSFAFIGIVVGSAALGGLLFACVGAVPGDGTFADASNDSAKPSRPDGDSSPDITAPDTGPSVVSDGGIDADASWPCDLSKPFEPPRPIAELNTKGDDYAARLLLGALTVVFTRCEPFGGVASCHTLRATRAHAGDSFGPAEVLAIPSGDGGTMNASADGDELYLDSWATGTQRIHHVVRTAGGDYPPLGESTVISALVPSSGDDMGPYITSDGRALAFSSSRPTNLGSTWHIFIAERGPQGELLAPSFVSGIAAIPTHQIKPVVTADLLTVYFGAKTGSVPETVWRATRSSRTATTFDDVRELEELSGDSHTAPTSISEDGCHILIDSNRSGGAGGFDIYEAWKPPMGGRDR